MNGAIASPLPAALAGRTSAGRVRGWRARSVVVVCVVALVVACPVVFAWGSGGGGAGGAAAGGSGWSAVPLGARGLVSSALGASEPGFRVHRSSAAGGLVAVNRGQRLRATFTPAATRITSSHGSWLGLRLTSVTGAGSSSQVGTARLSGRGNRVSYAYPGLTESYANGPLGLEQSVTIAGPARGDIAHGPVVVSMALSGDLRAVLRDGSVILSRNGRPVLAYRDLLVRDAHGRRIPARLALTGGRVQIRIQAAGAAFPLRVDPFVQSAELTASDGASGDGLGSSVAVSSDGSTIVAGAPFSTSYEGAVYVFTDRAGTWSQSGELTASGGVDGDDGLGSSVAVSSDGSTIVAGAPNRTVNGNDNQGAVYVFTGNASSGWSQSGGALTANDGAAYDYLGSSVAVSSDGSTIVAGAPLHDGYQGAVYVFTGNATSGWSQFGGALTASDGASDDELGFSVGVSGDGSTVVAGAPYHTPSGGKSDQGAVYVFTGNATSGWSQSGGALTASDGAANDNLGFSVGVSGDGSTVVAGAPYHTPSGGKSDQGAVYVFTGNATSGWSQSGGALTASDGAAYDQLGSSVAVSSGGSTIVAGAPYHTPSGGSSEQGAAYVFMPSVTETTTTTTTTVPTTTTTTTTTTVPVTTTTTETVPSPTTTTTTTETDTSPTTTTTTETDTSPTTTTTTETDTSPTTTTTTETDTSIATVTDTSTVSSPTTVTATATTTAPTTVTRTETTTTTHDVGPACSTTSRFVTHIRSKHITAREVELAGTAEAKCPDHITKIGIAIAHAANGKCSFLNSDHQFAPPTNCAPRDFQTANGTSRWTYTLHLKFPRGVYFLWEHATNNHNQSTHNTAHRHVYFRVS